MSIIEVVDWLIGKLLFFFHTFIYILEKKILLHVNITLLKIGEKNIFGIFDNFFPTHWGNVLGSWVTLNWRNVWIALQFIWSIHWWLVIKQIFSVISSDRNHNVELSCHIYFNDLLFVNFPAIFTSMIYCL